MFDDHLITNALILITLFTVCVSLVRNPNCSLALLFSLVTARLFTVGGEPELHYNIMIFFALICIFDVRNGVVTSLEMEENEINYAVGYLYIARMMIGLLLWIGALGSELAWVMSSLVLALQNVLILLGVFNGSSRPVNDFITDLRHSAESVAFPSRRV